MTTSYARRLCAYLVALICVEFFAGIAIQVLPRYQHEWKTSEQIDFWVASGTLALAAVTVWSVYVTRSVVGSEDRRHRQGLAPILDIRVQRKSVTHQIIVRDSNSSADRPRMMTQDVHDYFAPEVVITNKGLGPALNSTVTVLIAWADPTGLEASTQGYQIFVSALAPGDIATETISRPSSVNEYLAAKAKSAIYYDLFRQRFRTS